jgi:uncharacterized protein DUF4255
MSNALAIAAVTAVLRDLLNNGLIAHDLASVVGVVNVTAKAPDLIKTGNEESAQLNLFLYHMTPNAGWRNVGLPSRDARGDLLTNPPLALDLHYLLSAYGAQDFATEILLGYAMQILHETPVLAREAIRVALAPVSPVTGGVLPPAYQALSAADLADQIEQIKICPETLNLEELSKLWSAFQANHFRPTAAYHVSVVLIESKRSTRSTLPVQKYKIYPLPLKRPTIEQVSSAALPPANLRITAASTLVITGSALQGQLTRVRIGEDFAPPASVTVSDTQITFPLSAVASLSAGVQGVQVVHDVLLGEPETAHRGVESNVVAFVLHPMISAPATVTAVSGQITIGFTPNVGKAQRVTLFLNEFNAPDTRPARAYSFPAPKDNGISGMATDTASITFNFSGVVMGDYLVRVQVDGAESPLGMSAGQYDAPKVTIS